MVDSNDTNYNVEHFTSAKPTSSHIFRPRVNDVKYASLSLKLHAAVWIQKSSQAAL
jgi:hypothetical protein